MSRFLVWLIGLDSTLAAWGFAGCCPGLALAGWARGWTGLGLAGWACQGAMMTYVTGCGPHRKIAASSRTVGWLGWWAVAAGLWAVAAD